MFKKILSACSFLFLFIFITSSTILSEISPVQATQMSSDNKEDNSMGIVIEQSVNDFDGTKSSVEPDLGDDQAFPFIPGFGKNSGKD